MKILAADSIEPKNLRGTSSERVHVVCVGKTPEFFHTN
jgi:hypothetical protein